MTEADKEFWASRPVLVTGATGFLGGWLVRELLDRDADVVALLRREKPESQFAMAGFEREVAVVSGEVWDRDVLEQILDEHAIDVVFHTAMWGGDVSATMSQPVECLRSTVESTWWLLDALRRSHPTCAMIVSSSDKAYGLQQIPYREDQALLPHHPQEVAKASQDLMTQSFGKVYGLDVAVTRCANFFGPFDFNFTRVIPYVARCAAEGRAPQLRSDGSFIRDFLHVQDAARAHLLLAEQLAHDEKLRGEVFNFSHGVQMTVVQIVERILARADSDQVPQILDISRHEIPNMWLSSDKARRVLGWEPEHSFEEGLDATVDWYLDYFRR